MIPNAFKRSQLNPELFKLAEIMQLSKIQLNWRIWRMVASRSVILWETSKLLACLVEQFGSGINFLCSDLT